MFLEIAAPAAHHQMAWISKSHPEFPTIIDCRKCPCWSLSSFYLCLVFLLPHEKKLVSFLHCSDIAGSFSLGTLMKLALFSSSIGVLFQPPLKGTVFSSRSSSFQQALEDSVFSNHQDNHHCYSWSCHLGLLRHWYLQQKTEWELWSLWSKVTSF